MIVPLGVAVATNPSFGELLDRAKNRMALVAAGQENLKYLVSEEYIYGTQLEVCEGNFQLRAEIPVKQQADFFGHGQARTNPRAMLQRQDQLEQQAIDETVAEVQNSSRLLDRVAQAMERSGNLGPEIAAIEKLEGVDTRPARRFIYAKQEGFTVEIEDDQIPFRSHVVRAAVAGVDPIDLVMTLVTSKSESIVVRGLVHETHGTGSLKGLQSGGVHEFRFVGLEGWQKILLEAARSLRLPVRLRAAETLSTCTLEFRPADVVQVQNWQQLLRLAVSRLLEHSSKPDEGNTTPLMDAA